MSKNMYGTTSMSLTHELHKGAPAMHTLPRGRFSVRTIAILLIAVLAVFASVAPVGAQSQSAKSKPIANPNTIVSSDGVTPLVVANEAAITAFAPPSAGNGRPTNNRRLILPDLKAVSADGEPESIIGADNRYQVVPTTGYPARAVALMTMSTGRCTAWMIGPDTAVTAGHCVYSSGAWSSNVRVYPGYTGTSAPYGSCTARRLYSVTGWTSSGNTDYDYGAIKLNCTIGNTVGWFGFRWQSASLTGQSTTVQGYPGDKPYTQWGSQDYVRVSYDRKIFYANDTTGGQSGSPVYNGLSGCNPCGIAVHTNGTGLYGQPYNAGTRITQDVYNNLVAWKNAL
jgi:glutamyl endopeptidase